MRHTLERYLVGTLAALLMSVLGGCASAPRAPERSNDRGVAIATATAQLVGTPYHFGGTDEQGFDCSGLVTYVHERAGLQVPRTANEQKHAAKAVPLDAMLPGDVVFFRLGFHLNRGRVDHVGIYAGGGRFIHAPHAHSTVSYANLNEGYYRKHLVSAGRFWDTR